MELVSVPVAVYECVASVQIVSLLTAFKLPRLSAGGLSVFQPRAEL